MANGISSRASCCPSFDPKKWDGREFTWKNKMFVKQKVSNFFNCPPDFTETIERAKVAGALPNEPLMLSMDRELWASEVYVSVEKEIPEAEVVRFSGRFMAKVFEGSYKESRRLMEEMEKHVKSCGKKVKKMYFFYNVCSECGKTCGKEHTAIIAEV
jgi:hypothetical protein